MSTNNVVCARTLPVISRQMILIGIMLAIAQTLDAILTMIGIQRFGVRIEANAVLQSLMTHFDPYQLLAVLKSMAILVVITLVQLSPRVLWLATAMPLIGGVYLGSTVVPWLYIVFRFVV